MCLLIAMFKVSQDAPLIVAANRDEHYDRPATAITVLRGGQPAILGGRDELAGGTWMAVNENGLIAALTNLPSPGGRIPGRRSRGELPIALAAFEDAAAAVSWLSAKVNPADYNPCWLMIGDRQELYYADLTGGDHPAVRQLPPGSYVLENAPLEPQSPKSRHVAGLITAARGPDRSPDAADISAALAEVLRDHSAVPGNTVPGNTVPGNTGPGSTVPGNTGLRASSAACVHAGQYGTRSAMIVTVPATGLPRVQVADGPSCTVPLADVSGLWPVAGGAESLNSVK